MRHITDLIMDQNLEFKLLSEVCLDFITTLNEDIIKVISPKQYNLLKNMGKFLEKKLFIFAKSNKAKEDD